MSSVFLRARLHSIQALDRARLRRLAARHPGVAIDPAASSNFACARFELAPDARLLIGAGVVTERYPGALHFHIGEGAEISIADGTWLRSEAQPIYLAAFAGARLSIGSDGVLSGCMISAKESVEIGNRAWIGPGTRIYDAEHAIDADRPERRSPVRIGDCVWIAGDVTVLKGVEIGRESVVGTRAIVTRSIPAHSLAFGAPAVVRGAVGDRTAVEL